MRGRGWGLIGVGTERAVAVGRAGRLRVACRVAERTRDFKEATSDVTDLVRRFAEVRGRAARWRGVVLDDVRPVCRRENRLRTIWIASTPYYSARRQSASIGVRPLTWGLTPYVVDGRQPCRKSSMSERRKDRLVRYPRAITR